MKTSDTKSSQGYQVLARRFRPQQFDEILGQEPLVVALTNSIRLGRVGHAYLFCGPRGVGKTTVARILAKALNCATGSTEKPCDKCPNCREIAQGNALDVLEIDGASNRGIDEIRNLRENVKYMAASSRYKIYIIDEVHMLTQEAFNALLKTLEEPPAHVKFFFATTDPQRLPATILSRCQKFELKRIPAGLMVERLSALAKKEKVSLSQDAMLAIVQQAQGSMRDAESLLEVIIASGQTQIDFACVRDVLGWCDQEVYYEVVDAVFRGDAGRMLNLIADLFNQGREPGRFLAGFMLHVRNLLLAKALNNKADVLEMPAEQLNKLLAQAQPLAEEHLITMLDLSSRTEQQMRNASSPRVLLELFFMKALEYVRRPPLTELLGRLEQMESRLGSDAVANMEEEPPARAVKHEDSPALDSDARALWYRVAQSLGTTHPIIRTCMQEAVPAGWDNGQLIVHLKKGANFHKATLEDRSCQELIEQRMKELSGKGVKIKVDFVAETKVPAAGGPGPEEKGSLESSPGDMENDPALQDAMNILKGKIVKTTGNGG